MLALPSDKIKEALQEKFDNEQVLWRILRAGYIHILESLADKLGEPLKNILQLASKVDDTLPFVCYDLIRKGYFEEAEVLSKKQKNRVDFNIRNEESETVLFLAAVDGNSQLVNTLLKQGADPDLAYTATGATPLFVAACHGHLAVVKALLKSGAGFFTLQKCSSKALLDIIDKQNKKSMLEKFIRDHHKGKLPTHIFPKTTELHIAAWRGDEKMVALLLDHGANANLKTADGMSARDFAMAMDYPEVAFMIARREAQPLLTNRAAAFAAIDESCKMAEEKISDSDKNTRLSQIAAFNRLDQYAVRLTKSVAARSKYFRLFVSRNVSFVYYQFLCNASTLYENIMCQ